MIKKIDWTALVFAVLIPLGVGFLSALLSGNQSASFALVDKPPLSPPGQAFPIVWTILFVLMGIGSYLIYRADVPSNQKTTALTLYGIQLIVNFFWSIIFFGFEAYLFAFFWLILLWVLIILTIRAFAPISRTAALLLLPYLLWVTFAGYLNYGIYLLN